MDLDIGRLLDRIERLVRAHFLYTVVVALAVYASFPYLGRHVAIGGRTGTFGVLLFLVACSTVLSCVLAAGVARRVVRTEEGRARPASAGVAILSSAVLVLVIAAPLVWAGRWVGSPVGGAMGTLLLAGLLGTGVVVAVVEGGSPVRAAARSLRWSFTNAKLVLSFYALWALVIAALGVTLMLVAGGVFGFVVVAVLGVLAVLVHGAVLGLSFVVFYLDGISLPTTDVAAVFE